MACRVSSGQDSSTPRGASPGLDCSEDGWGSRVRHQPTFNIGAMKAGILIVGSLMVIGCAPSRSVDGPSGSPRFRNVVEIVVAPESGLSPVLTGGQPILPRFPANVESRNVRTSPSVAFVVDTTGAIEPRTVSFLNSAPLEYRRSICEWSRGVRFEPLVVDGVRRRGLTVSSFAFFRSETPFPPGGPPSHSREWAKTIGEMPLSELYPMLEKRPHC